jgi:type I restriction enzyme, S subunit
MELKQGYKQTEVGVIPEDWRICQLREVCTVLRGGSPRPIEDYLTENADGINWIKIGDVGAGAKYIDSTAEKILPSGMSRSRYVKPGDFLLSNSMSFGRPYILRIDGCIHDGWLVIGNYQNSFSSEYLYYCLSSDGVLAQYVRYAAGSSVLNLNKDVVSRVHVAIPGPQEQANISKALSGIDQLIEQLECLIYKKKNIKQAAMQELLTGKRRLPGFEGEWEVKRLGDLGEFLKGSGVKKDEAASGELPCVRYGEIYTHHENYISEFSSRISEAVAASATLIRQGDILFAGSGETKEEIGKSVVLALPVKAFAGGDIVILRQNTVDALFLGYRLNALDVSRQKAGFGQGDAVVHISAHALAKISVSVPGSTEQEAIAGILYEMDTELRQLQGRLSKTQSLKQGMMQQLLTGKIRLT